MKASLVTFLFISIITASAIAQAESLFKPLGLKAGMEYSVAKKQMLRLGWSIEAPGEDAQTPIQRFPEITCGNGWDAICFVRFLKNGKAALLVLKPNSRLTVLFADAD